MNSLSEEEKIIGHGTWYDKIAHEIESRERRLGRSLEIIRAESGLGASGFPHIGSLADALRAHAVVLALQERGLKASLIAFSDDMDALRKVPAGLPKELSRYLGFPVTSIPDPFKCHESYGHHMSALLLEALEACGVSYEHRSGREAYKRGLLIEPIRRILSKADVVGHIIDEEVGQEKYREVLPYFAVCEGCGRLTTQALKWLPDEDKVLYRCGGTEIAGLWLGGCGHEGEVSIKGDGGKLSWKVEFAARWAALDVRFEAYGKDIADSVRVNDRICREILGFEPPLHARYEMFLDKGGKKISKSAGNVLTPQLWLRYGSPESLRLLTLKRFVGTRRLDITDIPSYMDEFDKLEDIYFGRIKVSNARDRIKLVGLYEYVVGLKPPKEPNLHIPYNLLVYLAKVAPSKDREAYIVGKLREYGYKVAGLSEDLKRRIQYAVNWVSDQTGITETYVELTTAEKNAIENFIALLENEVDEGQVQNAVFEIARSHGIPPPRFFQILYSILLGSNHGPRLGPYVMAMGKDAVAGALRRALQAKKRK
ncbi:MAG: lysine--tRNA ligase [Candidatus Bathyarchaeia archaeon]